MGTRDEDAAAVTIHDAAAKIVMAGA